MKKLIQKIFNKLKVIEKSFFFNFSSLIINIFHFQIRILNFKFQISNQISNQTNFRIDKFYMDAREKSASAFVPPGRPRRWRERAFRVLEKTVVSRVEGNQLEDRSLNKAWLARWGNFKNWKKIYIDRFSTIFLFLKFSNLQKIKKKKTEKFISRKKFKKKKKFFFWFFLFQMKFSI